MKIRLGFVSNSSSSSFLVFGISDVDSINQIFNALNIKDSDGYIQRIEDYKFEYPIEDFTHGEYKLKLFKDEYMPCYTLGEVVLGEVILGQNDISYSEFQNTLNNIKLQLEDLSKLCKKKFDYRTVLITIPF